MLRELEVLNGEMTLKFDPLNIIYTINIEDEDELIIKYKVDEGYDVSIMGNEKLRDGENQVVISVYNESDVHSYYLYVLKNSEKIMGESENKKVSLEIEANNGNSLALPTISAICFIIILLLFAIIFTKKKSNLPILRKKKEKQLDIENLVFIIVNFKILTG